MGGGGNSDRNGHARERQSGPSGRREHLRQPAALRPGQRPGRWTGHPQRKVRKLEWTCGAALAAAATALVTSGAPQSNHARLTAAAGARLGLDVVLVPAGAPGSSASGNLALDGPFGATVVWAGDVDGKALGSTAEHVAEQLRRHGAVPALIPFGGSSVVGACDYAECGRELLVQAPDLATVVVAVGSGGTMAGLLCSTG
ncbi:pyridoxal-phosphate dependent enzyme [Streptomyces sp. NPDC088246]|uniref:pyridoxal-phosphate dependent enzyme n=1 Tax=Streptomyces sp. NPDC088246 TaxID=3365842 RepID=UPI00380646A6